MSTNAIVSQTLVFQTSALGGTSSSTQIDIADIESLDGPSVTRDTIDVTTIDATHNWREFKAGLIDGGTLTLGLNYQPANTTHQIIHDAITDGDLRFCTIKWSDTVTTSNFVFQAYAVGVGPSANVGGVVKANVTLKLSGSQTLPT